MTDVRYAWSYNDADGFTGRHRTREGAIAAALRDHAENVDSYTPVAIYTARRSTFKEQCIEPEDAGFDFLVTDVQLHEAKP